MKQFVLKDIHIEFADSKLFDESPEGHLLAQRNDWAMRGAVFVLVIWKVYSSKLNWVKKIT